MLRQFGLICILATLCFATSAIAETVTVTGGEIQGTTDGDVNVFKGIPFAAPPVGDLRWKPPQQVVPWDGVRDATEFSDNCIQGSYPEGSFYWRPERPKSEDCLCLNVWSTGEPGDDRPVMVWIHGGALTRGSGAIATYDGSNLAHKGVILVTVNYRLGPLGYLAHPELSKESSQGASGNYGVLDQIAALQWIQDNIKTFGGDPNRVTIFGESAGSWSVCALMGTPLSKGLFHRAIGESGGVFGLTPDLKKESYGEKSAEAVGVAFGKALGVDSLEAMRAVSADQIIETFASDASGRQFRTRACVDGWVYPIEIRAAFAQGKQQNVPVIVGSNANEMSSLTPRAFVPQTVEKVRERIEQQYGDAAKDYFVAYPFTDDASAIDAYLAGARDRTFSWQMRSWARAMSTVSSDAYLYYFTRVPPIPDSEYYGAFHAAEIAYAFDNLHTSERQYTDTDFKLSEAMSNYWVNFAATGNPNGEAIPQWDAYNEESEPYIELGDTVQQKNHLLKKENDFIGSTMKAQYGTP